MYTHDGHTGVDIDNAVQLKLHLSLRERKNGIMRYNHTYFDKI